MKLYNLIWYKDYGHQDATWKLLTDDSGFVVDDMARAIDLVNTNRTGIDFCGQVGLADTFRMEMNNAVWVSY